MPRGLLLERVPRSLLLERASSLLTLERASSLLTLEREARAAGVEVAAQAPVLQRCVHGPLSVNGPCCGQYSAGCLHCTRAGSVEHVGAYMLYTSRTPRPSPHRAGYAADLGDVAARGRGGVRGGGLLAHVW